MKADARWIPAFRARFEAWWVDARPLIADRQYGPALRTYPWPTFAETPWTPVEKPLAESTIAVVTTAGLYRAGIDVPFNREALEGDPSFRAIPRATDPATLAIGHAHFPHDAAKADINTIFPLERLEELRREGAIGDLAATHYSTMGYALRADDLAVMTAPTIAALMREDRVDVALVIPVCAVCHQSGGLVQREIEGAGIPTVSLSNDPDGTERVRPPRWVEVQSPEGSMLGEPGDRVGQLRVLRDVLDAFDLIDVPGGRIMAARGPRPA